MSGQTNSCKFKANGFRRDELEHLVEVLQAVGITINYEISNTGRTATLAFEHLPSVDEARARRTRNAGAPKTAISLPSGSAFSRDTTCLEFLDWLEDHTHEEAMRQLGLKRATYFRRLKLIREHVEWERAHNPKRLAQGIGELHHTLGNL